MFTGVISLARSLIEPLSLYSLIGIPKFLLKRSSLQD
ncbi:Uncharacterised protein [Vibrio cholerae]|nr:Uncharacterised protein [Vibrio cholerae]CSI26342.1 Uncharacterised protein [Vibrio cholerae]